MKRLVRRFGLLVLLTLVGGTAGAVYGLVKTPTYTAQAYVVVTGEAGESIAALNFAQAYGRVATKGASADRAAAILGSREPLKKVTASTSPDAPVIEITATGADPKVTAAAANAVAQALVEFGSTRKTETRVSLAVLSSAAVPSAPTSPKPPLELAVGAAAGLLIGGLSVLAGVGRRSSSAAQPAVVPAPVRGYVAPYPQAAPTLVSWYGNRPGLPAAPAGPPIVDSAATSVVPQQFVPQHVVAQQPVVQPVVQQPAVGRATVYRGPQ